MRLTLVVGVFLLFACLVAVEGSPSPVRLIAVCKAGEGRMEVIRGWLISEPSFSGIVIPARYYAETSAEDINRMIRIYFPRTYEETTDYDFILLASVDMVQFTDTQEKWMYDAMADAGLGGMNTRSVQSQGQAYSSSWMNSIVSEVFPNDVPAVFGNFIYKAGSGSFPTGPIKVNDDPKVTPVVRPFKEQVERAFTIYSGVLTIPRPGSIIHTWIKSPIESVGDPLPGYIAHLFEWRYRNSTTFTAMDMINQPFWGEDQNPYSLDIIANVVWHSTSRELPDDAMVVHGLRTLFRQYSIEKSIIISMAEFAENFGANTQAIYSSLNEIEERKETTDSEYLAGNFGGSFEGMGAYLDELYGLEEELLKLKNRALFWIYIIEWTTVTSTGILCATGVWTLMVRRRLYQEVDTTRFTN